MLRQQVKLLITDRVGALHLPEPLTTVLHATCRYRTRFLMDICWPLTSTPPRKLLSRTSESFRLTWLEFKVRVKVTGVRVQIRIGVIC